MLQKEEKRQKQDCVKTKLLERKHVLHKEKHF